MKDFFEGIYQTSDGSVLNRNNEVVLFSVKRFIQDIGNGNCCFICGIDQKKRKFNNEHVIPRWVLRELNLFSKQITLPNGNTCQYGQYTVPCCVRCNDLLGEYLETPISELFKGGLKAVNQHLVTQGPWWLFIWLCLLFIKTHINDKTFRWFLDRRQGDTKISEIYDWQNLHHIHCIARSCLTKPYLDKQIIGSTFVIPASNKPPFGTFDFGDLYRGQSIFFRFQDVAILSVLNDSGGCFATSQEYWISKLRRPLTPMQLRELNAKFGYLNTLIKNRPRFTSIISGKSYKITGEHPSQVELNDWEAEAYGEFLFSSCSQVLEAFEGEECSEMEENLKKGRWTFLFDEEDNHIESIV